MKAEVWNITNLRCADCKALLAMKVEDGREWIVCSNRDCEHADKRFNLPTIELQEIA